MPPPILQNKFYASQSVFTAENLLREGHRQKSIMLLAGALLNATFHLIALKVMGGLAVLFGWIYLIPLVIDLVVVFQSLRMAWTSWGLWRSARHA